MTTCDPHIWDAMGRRCIRCTHQAPKDQIERNRVAIRIRRLLVYRAPGKTRALQNELVLLSKRALEELWRLLEADQPVKRALDRESPPGA